MASPVVTDYPSALEFLLHRINYERTSQIPYRAAEFKLERMRRLMALLGEPHLGLKAVHIAGTKGKGSSAAMLEAALRAAGYRTGLYTSPHLSHVEERIVLDGRPCPRELFAAVAAELQEAVGRLEAEGGFPGQAGPTFFEITTAMAFLAFARLRVDVAVLEVGLGGRLDSTNVCCPEVCLITSISFDHMRQLGHTLREIAWEKAGIIKPGVPVVSGVVAEEPRDVIAQRAEELGAFLVQRGRDYEVVPHEALGSAARDAEGGTWPEAGERFDYVERAGGEEVYRLADLRVGMLGAHQAINAAGVVATLRQMVRRGWSIDEAALRKGLSEGRLPGRVEVVSRQPLVVVDVAHNPAAIEALLTTLQGYCALGRRVLIFASSKDKDYRAMLQRLLPAFDVVLLTRYVENPRAAPPELLLTCALALREEQAACSSRRSGEVHLVACPQEAWRLARLLASPEDWVCVTGSFFLVAELRPTILADVGAAAGRAMVRG
jgi:dihydrofolate synthase/folylpolyglutamate synthase